MSPPFGEVWIEINLHFCKLPDKRRHFPSGRCGLKYFDRVVVGELIRVTSLRGGVD